MVSLCSPRIFWNYVNHAGLKITQICLPLSHSTGFKGMYHHAQFEASIHSVSPTAFQIVDDSNAT